MRRFFQIHLLTAVAGMFTAAAFIGLNLTVFTLDLVECDDLGGGDSARLFVVRYFYLGWPLEISDPVHPDVISSAEIEDFPKPRKNTSTVEEPLAPAIIPTVSIARVQKIKKSNRVLGDPVLTLEDIRRQDPSMEDDIDRAIRFKTAFPSWDANFYWKGIAINAVVALAMTLAAMIGIEWFLRRREAVKV